jgi:predicted SnoaL-like aldol condensation-catalyzing enzyme
MRAFLRILFCALAMLHGAAAHSADTKHNTELAKRVFFEKMAQGKFDETREIYTADFLAHGANGSFNLEQDIESGRAWRRGFPDLHVAVERTAAQGDLVAVHWRAIGTNTVAAGGMPGNGAKVNVQGMTFFRFVKGRIRRGVEPHRYRDVDDAVGTMMMIAIG